MDLLRFITAGSVDDGKSTLIGRLLYDSKNILIDQLEQLERQSKNKESGEIDLAFLTDGLRAEPAARQRDRRTARLPHPATPAPARSRTPSGRAR